MPPGEFWWLADARMDADEKTYRGRMSKSDADELRQQLREAEEWERSSATSRSGSAPT
jgi:hypothetical protein